MTEHTEQAVNPVFADAMNTAAEQVGQPTRDVKPEPKSAVDKLFVQVFNHVQDFLSAAFPVQLEPESSNARNIHILRNALADFTFGIAVSKYIECNEDACLIYSISDFAVASMAKANKAVRDGNEAEATQLLNKVITRYEGSDDKDWADRTAASVAYRFEKYQIGQFESKLKRNANEKDRRKRLTPKQRQRAEGLVSDMKKALKFYNDLCKVNNGIPEETDKNAFVTSVLKAEIELKVVANKAVCFPAEIAIYKGLWSEYMAPKHEARKIEEAAKKAQLDELRKQRDANNGNKQAKKPGRNRNRKNRNRKSPQQVKQAQQRGKANAQEKQRQKTEERLGNEKTEETIANLCSRLPFFRKDKVQTALEDSGKSVHWLLHATEAELTGIPGIGEKSAIIILNSQEGV